MHDFSVQQISFAVKPYQAHSAANEKAFMNWPEAESQLCGCFAHTRAKRYKQFYKLLLKEAQYLIFGPERALFGDNNVNMRVTICPDIATKGSYFMSVWLHMCTCAKCVRIAA